MMGSKCGCCGNRKKLCPFSLGLALGITVALSVLIWSLLAIYYGATPMMTMMHIPVPTMTDAWMCALWGLIKGFVFGFFLALFYDMISCCCVCCRKSSCCCCKGENKGECTIK